ncbi:ATP-binding protein [Occallatibacter riparius]|uniref:histidine kinase n=1 Tax=Occallatibacter riparius TaxID=1002689 RepID=A0A9J7BL32_9BACT|nr:ATP-binding protein [Occallatibacter riparius]UWZ81957.1 ATP-binding protein [Occallatibacter riparius]
MAQESDKPGMNWPVDGKPVQTEDVQFAAVEAALKALPRFAESDLSVLNGPEPLMRVTAPAESIICKPGESPLWYSVVLEGKLRADRQEQDGSLTAVGFAKAGEGFGETPLLYGKESSTFFIRAVEDSVLVRLSEQQFWDVMSCCPAVRKMIVHDMSERVSAYQVEALHREKLVTLGTLAAGLMHELHNPGSAAKRSAAQLRENLRILQELGVRIGAKPKTAEQLSCIQELLRHTMQSCRLTALSSVDQADAEEELSQWLESAGVENAWTIGPALVEMGFQTSELQCAQVFFERGPFSDVLNWLGAMVSSMKQVCTIEESLGRVSDLVSAVKKFAYDEKSPARDLDVHDSLQSTLTILGHKLRIKQIKVEKRFDASPSVIETRGSALSQVWTNLIDNAADASPANGKIEIATWTEPEWLVISIGDQGAGIPEAVLPHIWEAFFTTKPQGSGTGLGLDIVHRIVTQKFDGQIAVESKPGDTRFIVRLPRRGGNYAQRALKTTAHA